MKPSTLFGAVLASTANAAITLDLQSPDSIKAAAKTAAEGMVKYYNGNKPGFIPGLLGDPYYWWEAGAMFGALVDYWYYTGDDTFNDITTQALLFQVGPDVNYMPPNQSKSLGNDDQAFWGMAAMSAAEVNYPNPPDDEPQWLALAQAVFNSQAIRWDNTSCGGGLKWQIFTFNNGYNYKNSISNGCFFNLAARLGAYTNNATYFDWANRMWDWVTDVGLMSDSYQIFDGSDDNLNCSEFNHIQWSYNAGVFLYGAALMWNKTEDAEQAKWEGRLRGLLDTTTRIFFQNNVMYEVACEPSSNCNIDQQSFKAYLTRWMAATTKVVPWTHDIIMPLIQQSAQACAKTCSGNSPVDQSGTACGTKWTQDTWDNTFGVGQQMNALEVFQSNLIDAVAGPLGNDTGGTSKGDPSAGSGGDRSLAPQAAITTSDRAGAGILTALVLVGLVGGAWWMVA
ncbi:Mannan endo-1,6-alpha-mannosidase DCW1 [Fulvia fulva]|uniref:Mannan endo-1,6-alpha-mannosidase n=1 Tax=Passalora fulva TaxID=5499 RepID=A0A9Q8L518_PASFU|nr:Mannan endo-1,6-alpha-mannosidase DCW1 [Fulvia fulva]KAK4635555.1 Mannan endo-1,6-alpha-mannosidase DCW1 [Fulvia fulva]KAK4636572.1 Mannan endo-1,6-alpha-mannosidase DCW1 [Fulvia fulva]UJO10931.1 Mannan endo-1,6-alpha-mannosidase DCW1 [Fulvia fulva]WPV08147.1 Mannan endo-1,6-alpha-mannosidase DCW1 [Fulvia fulva]WPV24265.1 Mannan endo-1,6-alpha-mannosidase DCW1 [Fulvia fulva]